MKSKLNIKLITGGVVGILLIGIVTAIILNTITPRDSDNAPTDPVASSPKEIIEALKTSPSLGNLSSLYTEIKTPIGGFNDINYTTPNGYAFTQSATDFVQYERTDTSQTDNDTETVTAIASLLNARSLKEVTAPDDAPMVYTIYDGDQATCQLLNLPKMNGRAPSLSIACVSKAAIIETHKAIDALLALYADQSPTPLRPVTIKVTTFTEDTKTLTTLDAYNANDTAKSLLFAAINDDWEYLGERPLSAGTTEANTTPIDRSLSPQLKTKIADPKYDGFLVKYIK